MGIKYECDKCFRVRSEEMTELHITRKRNTRYGYDYALRVCDECFKEEWFYKKK